MQKYKFALIGCGRISYKHINAINAIENAELVTVCNLERRKVTCLEYKNLLENNSKTLYFII